MGQNVPDRSRRRFPIGASSDESIIHPRSFAGDVELAVWCHQTPSGGDGNPPELRARVCHPSVVELSAT
jgi:hypothetical protein